jgi:hypothetical protein
MWRPAVACTFLAVSAGILVSGCAATCEANPQKLALLRRGMSYDETAAVMGCPGQLVSEQSPLSSDYATVEWNGPDSIFFKRTQIDFLYGKLLSYTTENRGAL